MDPATRGSAPFTPYGPWASLALTAAVLVCAELLSEGLILLVASTPEAASPTNHIHMLSSMVISSLLGVAALAKLVDMRAPGRIADYLALRWVDSDTAWRWLAAIAVYLVAALAIQALLRGTFDIQPPPNPLDGVEVGPLFLLAVVIVGPAFEELLFRGFLMEGLMPTRLGQVGALTVSTLLWALLHAQYDAIGMVLVFGCGMILGLARLNTGSLLLSIVLHGAFNGLSILISVL